jgi:hypothetical protein
MTDLKQRLAAVLASARGQAMIEEGQQFSIEELQTAFAQVLAEAKDHERVVLDAAMNAVIARKLRYGRWARETGLTGSPGGTRNLRTCWRPSPSGKHASGP